MAPTPAKDAGKKDAGKKGGGLVVALLVLTVLAGGLGGGLGFQLAGTVEKVVSAKIAAEPKVEPPAPLRYSGDMTLKEMKALVVNLASPSSAFVRIEAGLVFKNGALANPDVTAAEIREDMMAYVRTLSLSQLEGPSALQHLREDINDRAGVRSEGKVAEVIIQSLVVQ